MVKITYYFLNNPCMAAFFLLVLQNHSGPSAKCLTLSQYFSHVAEGLSFYHQHDNHFIRLIHPQGLYTFPFEPMFSTKHMHPTIHLVVIIPTDQTNQLLPTLLVLSPLFYHIWVLSLSCWNITKSNS